MLKHPDSISVLLICQTYPPYLGGSEIEAQRVSAELIRRGHRVQVVCAGGEPMPKLKNWTDPHGVPVRSYAGRWNGKARDLVYALRVAMMILREGRQYDVVYFVMQGLHLAIGLPLARVLGKPVVMKLSGSAVISWMSRTSMGRRELRWLRKWAARVIVLNDDMMREAEATGFRPSQLEWMPNPVDTNEFFPGSQSERADLRASLGLPPGAPVVIYTGRLAPEKALPELLAGFSALVQHHPHAVLALVGDGPMRADLEAVAANLGLDSRNLRFAGKVAPERVSAWLRAADIFALVSPMEGFSCALAEAMASGLACVVTDISANVQLITPGKTGLLVPVGDAAALAAALQRLAADPGLRATLGRAARDLVQAQYTPGRVAERYEALFQAVLGHSRRSTSSRQALTAGEPQ